MEIRPYGKNAKKHPKKQVEQIAKSIKEFGWQQPIVVDNDGVIIVGHGRWQAYNGYKDKLGLPEPEIRVAKDLTKSQVKAYRLADNKLNESDWDMELVIDDLKDLDIEEFDVSLTGFDKDLIIEPDEKDDEIPELPEEAKSLLGEIYQLGDHRLMCGDANNVDDVGRLMDGSKADLVVTDPPYNTGMSGKNNTFDYDWSKGKKQKKEWLSHMFNDNIENWGQFIKDFLNSYFLNTKGECAFYVFIDWRRVQDIRKEMEIIMDVKNVIVWDKKVHGLGSDYKSTYELCIVGKKGKPEIKNRYGLDYQDIWRLQRQMGRNEMHATVKPVELLEKPIKHASKEDDIVLDLFGGSGSTLIACEKLKRKCYMMELEPKYIDTVIKRWEGYTGQKAKKL